jgi:glycosyltransferase involved in cell wall biosynthesis
MAAFNEEAYIGAAIQSILDQTYTNFEFIIINDGSTDSTEIIIQSFQDPRIKYIKNEVNLKLIDSLNLGLLKGNGKYIARMDADDISLTSRLEKQVKFMEENPDVGISGAQLNVFGNETGPMNFPEDHEDIRLHLLITSAFGNNVVVFRRDVLERHGLYFPKGYLHAEDYKCWTLWVEVCKTHNLSEALVNYRAHSGSVSTKNRNIQRETRNRIRQEYVQSLFNLNTDTAMAFTGRLNGGRCRAIRHIMAINKSMHIFNTKKLQHIVCKAWYLDALEKSEESATVLLAFVRIFTFGFGFKYNLKNWANVFKHYIKFRIKTNG